jgi:hypothetical protein
MDFETFLQSEALRPLSIIYSRALLDCPETASVIARLPPPRIAMLYHAALMRAHVMEEDRAHTQAAERISARIVSAYGLASAEPPAPSTRQRPQKQSGAAVQGLGEPATGSEKGTTTEATRFLSSCSFPPPLSVRHVGFEHLERALAQREAALQQSVVESMMQLSPATAKGTVAPSPKE